MTCALTIRNSVLEVVCRMILGLNFAFVWTIMAPLVLSSWTHASISEAVRSISTVAFLQKHRLRDSRMFVHFGRVLSTKAQVDRFHSHSNFLTMITHRASKSTSSSLLMTTTTGGSKTPEILHISRAQMEEILEDYENGGREESQYCVIDVRTEEEVSATGKLGENVYTLPVQVIMQSKVFEMDPEAFEEYCQFTKPTMDETIVFSCAAGIRSVYACQFAAQAGYTKLINYTGGANEWFSPQ